MQSKEITSTNAVIGERIYKDSGLFQMLARVYSIVTPW
jgi:hypothetical protein